MGRTLWTCCAALGLWMGYASASAQTEPLASEALYDKSRALIVGIEQYPQGRSVPGAVEEAKQVTEAFRQLGFEDITELYNKEATTRRLHQALIELFGKKVDRSGRLVVFFAGQTGTIRDAKGREMGYLVPADAQSGNSGKFVTVETMREFTKRSPSKHVLLIVNAPFSAWEGSTAKSQAPLMSDARVFQIIGAGKEEKSVKPAVKSSFVQALVSGLSGGADLDENGWLTASELGAFVKQHVNAVSVRVEGEGDTVLLQQKRKPVPVLETQQPSHDREAAKVEYEQAVAQLQGGKYAEGALGHLNRAIEADPTFAEAYILKSYLRLEILPQFEEALDAARQGVKYAPDNSDAFYTLGLVHERMAQYREAEQAFVQAAKLNPENLDVFFSLGTLYEDHLNDTGKSVEAFRRYLQLGGVHARARAAVSQAEQAVSSSANTSQ